MDFRDNDELFNTELIDSVVTAEIPYENLYRDLYKLVKQHMIHGPCGYQNLNSACMASRPKSAEIRRCSTGRRDTTLFRSAVDISSRGPKKSQFRSYRRREAKNAPKTKKRQQTALSRKKASLSPPNGILRVRTLIKNVSEITRGTNYI